MSQYFWNCISSMIIVLCNSGKLGTDMFSTSHVTINLWPPVSQNMHWPVILGNNLEQTNECAFCDNSFFRKIHNIHINGEIWTTFPKLSLLPLLSWNTEFDFQDRVYDVSEHVSTYFQPINAWWTSAFNTCSSDPESDSLVWSGSTLFMVTLLIRFQALVGSV